MTDWHRLDIAGLRAAYAGGRVTPQAVLRHHLDRIERLDPVLRSFVDIDHAGAAAAADKSAERWRGGTARALEGVPVAVKANLAVAGLEWGAGMGARRGIVAAQDAAAVTLLRAAGAVILGTLNMHEAALGATTDNPFFGRATNAHDAARTPGGSSGGSGAAVAAGLCTASLGTDTMGSVRIPAAYNGVYGLKPGAGAISPEGLVPLSEALDSIGPIARSLDDLAVLAEALGVSADMASEPARLVTLDESALAECEAAVLSGLALAANTLDLPQQTLALQDELASVQFAGFVTVAGELAGHLADTPRDLLSAELRFMLDHAARQDAVQAADILKRIREAVLQAIGRDGVLLTPAAPQVAFAHTRRPPPNQAIFTALANIAGLPAIVLPVTRDKDGMPVAVQLIGPPGGEGALLSLARRIDGALSGFTPSPMLLS